MKSTKLFKLTTSNVATVIFLLLLTGMMAWLITGDISRMKAATSNYEYYQNAIYLIDNIARTYFFCIFMLMVFLTYINKQYSKWCVRLFYIAGASTLAYYAIASNYYGYVFNHVESEYMDKTVSMARSLFTGPLYWIIIGYFFVPKILKDAQKLKEEQELTI